MPSEIKPPLVGFHLVSLSVVNLIGSAGFPCLVGLSMHIENSNNFRIQMCFVGATSFSADDHDVARQVHIVF